MLVLDRKVNQFIRIGDGTKVTLLNLNYNAQKVQLSVTVGPEINLLYQDGTKMEAGTEISYTARVHQPIHLGNRITIEITEIRRYQVKIGINAPKSVAVHREEIYQRILKARGKKANLPGSVAS